MHNNFYFLRQLSVVLEQQLRGFTLVSCFSQNKDELLIEFNNASTSFFIQASLDASLSCLSFPPTLSRARKNSVDLFPETILKKVTGIRQYDNERSFSVALEDDLHLLFRMHGTRANVILIKHDAPINLFRNHLQADWEVRLSTLDRTIDWSEGFFMEHQATLRESYFTFGKQIWKYLEDQGFAQATTPARWAMFQSLLKILRAPDYLICEIDAKLMFLLVPEGKVVNRFKDPVQAITTFYRLSVSTSLFSREHSQAIRQLRVKLEGGRSYLVKNQQKLDEILADSHYQQWADLIMANMNSITTGAEKITLENFYDENKPIEIKLKKTLNAQKNAEVFYRKSKNQQVEIQKLKESMAVKSREIQTIAAELEAIQNETGLKQLRALVGDSGVIKDPKEKQPEVLPFHELEFKGYRILVGRNAESNDILTLKYSYKEDLWLHAKDVAGSHVLIKHQAGKNFPKDVIEFAAQVAAYNSKRKNESLCPVTVTPKKFVRKRKGDPAGTVVVEREEVVLVKPSANLKI